LKTLLFLLVLASPVLAQEADNSFLVFNGTNWESITGDVTGPDTVISVSGASTMNTESEPNTLTICCDTTPDGVTVCDAANCRVPGTQGWW
jgi:hypothetical protein